MEKLKTLYNIGKHTDTSGSMPKYDVIEKEKVCKKFIMPINMIFFILKALFKDYEVRKYFRNKYAILRLKQASSNENDKDKGVESVTKHVWRLMKYTQGENNQKVKMTLHLPVIVKADSSLSKDEDKPEVTIMVTLPIEYQDYNEGEPSKEAPKPDDSEIVIEFVEEFQGIVKYVSIKH